MWGCQIKRIGNRLGEGGGERGGKRGGELCNWGMSSDKSTEPYLGSCETSIKEHFVKIVNS